MVVTPIGVVGLTVLYLVETGPSTGCDSVTIPHLALMDYPVMVQTERNKIAPLKLALVSGKVTLFRLLSRYGYLAEEIIQGV